MATAERGTNRNGGERWRLFAATPVNAAVRGVIEGFQKEFAPRSWPVRWVRPDLAHITVKFFGDTEVAAVPALEKTLSACAQRAAPALLTTTGVGAFPSLARPRVIWLGLNGEVRRLERLALDVESATSGGTPEGRGKPFKAHITIGRVRDDAPRISDMREAVEAATQPAVDLGVDRLQLVRSVLGPGGSTYTTVAEWPLGRRESREHG